MSKRKRYSPEYYTSWSSWPASRSPATREGFFGVLKRKRMHRYQYRTCDEAIDEFADRAAEVRDETGQAQRLEIVAPLRIDSVQR